MYFLGECIPAKGKILQACADRDNHIIGTIHSNIIAGYACGQLLQ